MTTENASKPAAIGNRRVDLEDVRQGEHGRPRVSNTPSSLAMSRCGP
jgi:hypothetical protein